MSTTVSLFFMRYNAPDFTVTIKAGPYGYDLKVEDEHENYKAEFTFETSEAAVKYVKILLQQILNDKDRENHFNYFQYSIPFFPAIVMPLKDLECCARRSRVLQAIRFFFDE
jgi:hypothetical protein